MSAKAVYSELVNILDDYLGPASERFLEKLVDYHLHKDAKSLTKQDIPKLASWIRVSIGLLTEDRNSVDDCEKRVMQLAR